MRARLKAFDPRYLQIMSLGCFLLFGVLWNDFEITPVQMILTFLSGFLSQRLGYVWSKQLTHTYKSVWITCLALCLLVRSNEVWVHPVLAFVGIFSKFIIRFNQRHVFNPANLGLMVGLLFFPHTWVSPGQWGKNIIFLSWIGMLGLGVSTKALRLDLSLWFLSFHALFFTLRIMYLGDTFEIWIEHFLNGALLLFTFFMVSDPLTAPSHPKMRVLHVALVAGLAHVLQYRFFVAEHLFWALFLLAPLTILWEKALSQTPYTWPK